MKALFFDCDGVLVDTERDGHRVAFNRAFQKAGIDAEWSFERYGELLKVAGGKERMRVFFDQTGWPGTETEKDELIVRLHASKTEIFLDIIESGSLPVRPGIKRIVDEAQTAGLTLAVCSTSNEKSVTAVVNRLLGRERATYFAGIFAGDIVPRKKPDPAVYLLASERLGIAPADCVVVEDSRNGLLAAVAAGMKCVVTKSAYTGGEGFSEACAVYHEFGDPPEEFVPLKEILARASAAK